MSRSPRSCVGPSSAPQQIHMPRAACAGAQWLRSWARHNSDNITTARRGVQASIIDVRSARSIRRASFEEPVSCRRRMHTRMQARHEMRRARKCGSYPAGLDKMENYTGCALMLDENRVSDRLTHRVARCRTSREDPGITPRSSVIVQARGREPDPACAINSPRAPASRPLSGSSRIAPARRPH
jgi:hypothetical protein